MQYRVKHVSTLSYAAPVASAWFNLRLVPRLWHGQTMTNHSLVLDPQPARLVQQIGPYWVNTTQIGFEKQLDKLTITSEFITRIAPVRPAGNEPHLSQVRAQALAQKSLSDLSPAPYLFESRIARRSPAIAEWSGPLLSEDVGVIDAVRSLMQAIHSQFGYSPGATDSATPPEQAFQARGGVCQDFAHIMIIALRSAGLPAAYVSGYLLTLPPPGREKLVGADAMHAWVNVWCGQELGWVGFDPTNNCLALEDHIPIGMGRDYADISPIDGTFIGNAPQSVATFVDVSQID